MTVETTAVTAIVRSEARLLLELATIVNNEVPRLIDRLERHQIELTNAEIHELRLLDRALVENRLGLAALRQRVEAIAAHLTPGGAP